MGIEGGSSNNEVQNQEINQSNNEQIEQNQAEHQRSGEELEGNSTIDNEGERKQIEGKDDATESNEDESSKLDNDDSIENDQNQEQPLEGEGNTPEQQQLDNQDAIEGDSSADGTSDDNQEITDSLDSDDLIEDDTDSLDGENTETSEPQDSLDQDDAIDSDDDVNDVESNSENDGGDSLDNDDSIEDNDKSDNPQESDETDESDRPEESEEADEGDKSEESDETDESDKPEESEEADEGDKPEESDEADEGDKPEESDEADGGDKLAETAEGEVKSPSEIQEGIDKYYADCTEIGKNPDMTPSEKVDAMKEKFEDLGDGNRGDAQCIASDKYLDSKEPFRDNGRANVAYPDHQGFNMEEGKAPEAISRDNPMQDSVDRYGSSGGNFVAGMEDGEPASFESRALPNVENPDSYHSYDVDNGRYCDAIDMVRNCDPDNMQPTIDSINGMIDDINKEQGLDLDHIDSDDMKDMMAHYNDYQNNLARDIPEISIDDAPYGLSGEAAPWDTDSGERLSEGGADQKWLPLTVDDFENMGIFKENK